MGKDIGTFLAGIVLLAGIFVMVRPGSQGPTLVKNVTGGISSLVKSATGGGNWS
ncbi:MAG TPA: hypothetical protein VN861_14620 [Candidatus Acidoferrales bacterium]|jgi:hypothetical protein|nr:hypothetical protein [Candidatus Acidoferrales bacterium]